MSLRHNGTISVPATGATRRRPRTARRGLSLVEMLIALAITSTLLTSVMVALDASFKAYQATTEMSSRQTISRLVMYRILTLLRTGTDFGPYPANVLTDPVLESDYVEFLAPSGDVLRVVYEVDERTLFVIVDPAGTNQKEVLLTGVQPQYDDDSNRILPFTLHYEVGPRLHRATIDMLVGEDDAMELGIEGHEVTEVRLVSSIMPRND